jgi:hypothetical protein
MKHFPFPEFFEKSQCILGEGAVIERLRRNSESSVLRFPESIGNILILASNIISPCSFPPQPGEQAENVLKKRVMKKRM